MEKVRGMGLKPFVIISFNPLAEAGAVDVIVHDPGYSPRF